MTDREKILVDLLDRAYRIITKLYCSQKISCIPFPKNKKIDSLIEEMGQILTRFEG